MIVFIMFIALEIEKHTCNILLQIDISKGTKISEVNYSFYMIEDNLITDCA